jgi:hypothetical protein
MRYAVSCFIVLALLAAFARQDPQAVQEADAYGIRLISDALGNPDRLSKAMGEFNAVDGMAELNGEFLEAVRLRLDELRYSGAEKERIMGLLMPQLQNGILLCGSFSAMEARDGGKRLGSAAVLEFGHVVLCLLYEWHECKDEFKLSGIVCVNSGKYSAEPAIEALGGRFWLVLRVGADWGTGVDVSAEVWFDTCGAQSLSYPIDSARNLFHSGTAWASMKVASSYAKFAAGDKSGVRILLSLDFSYMDERICHATESIAYVYDKSADEFEYTSEGSTLRPLLAMSLNKMVLEDLSVWSKYKFASGEKDPGKIGMYNRLLALGAKSASIE